MPAEKRKLQWNVHERKNQPEERLFIILIWVLVTNVTLVYGFALRMLSLVALGSGRGIFEKTSCGVLTLVNTLVLLLGYPAVTVVAEDSY